MPLLGYRYVAKPSLGLRGWIALGCKAKRTGAGALIAGQVKELVGVLAVGRRLLQVEHEGKQLPVLSKTSLLLNSQPSMVCVPADTFAA